MKVLALPNDILYDVFLLITEYKQISDDGSKDWERCLTPWNLSATCKQWRTVCLNSPRLWTKLHFRNHRCIPTKGPARSRDTCGNSLGLLRYYLALDRAKDRSLIVNASVEGRAHECCASMLQILSFRRRNTWTALKLGTAVMFMVPWTRFSAQLATLETLDVDTYFHVNSQINPDSLDSQFLNLPQAFADLENIRAVRIGGLIGASPSLLEHLPWIQLQVVSLHRYTGTSETIMLLLQLCHNLRSLHLHCTDHLSPPRDMTSFPLGSVIAPFLEALEIETASVVASSSGPIMSILPSISTPKLTCMRINVRPDINLADEQTIVGLLRRSSCHLTHLELEIAWCMFAPVTDFLLRELKDLRACTLSYRIDWDRQQDRAALYDCADSFLEQLIAKDGSPIGLPRLERFKLRNLTFEPALLIQIVESRLKKEGFTAISALDVEFARLEEVARLALYRSILSERLAPAIRGGLQITFRSM